MSGHARPGRATATGAQAGVLLGCIAMGSTVGVGSGLVAALAVGLVSGLAVFALYRWQSRGKHRQGPRPER